MSYKKIAKLATKNTKTNKLRGLFFGLAGMCLVSALSYSAVIALSSHQYESNIPNSITSASRLQNTVNETNKTTAKKPKHSATAPKSPTKPKTAPAPVVQLTQAVVPSPSSNVNSLKPTGHKTETAHSSKSTLPTGSPTQPSIPTLTTYSSTNWAGYMATGSHFTGVSGSWVVPNPTSNGPARSSDAAWVGIGGVTKNDLIQIGTLNTIEPSGQVSTMAFYEMLPSAAINIKSITAHPGDSMSAKVTETSVGHFVLSIINNSNGQSFTINQSYNSSHSSAEWIQEAPSYSNGRQVPLDSFGSVTFTDAKAVASGVSATVGSIRTGLINMVSSGGATVATTSTIGSDGVSFTVSRN